LSAIIISLFALVATFYQLYLQRIHNEKSLKPLLQIDFNDRNGLLFVRITNNGVGPVIIESLEFRKGQHSYSYIKDCLEIDPRTYNHLDIDVTNKKVIQPTGFIEVFSKLFDEITPATEISHFRKQLSPLVLKVKGEDIYNNKIVVEKSLKWFARHEE
jgi:hypothetical protein